MKEIAHKISDRLGGVLFDQQPLYKFEKIKRAKQGFIRNHPQIPLLDFGIGEPDGMPPECAIQALREACAWPRCQGYADNGAIFFKEAALRYMANLFNVCDLNQNQCLPIIGIKSSLGLLAGTLINPGDVAACPIPGYGVFATQVQYFQGQVYPVLLKEEHGFLPDLNAIPESIKEKIKVFYVNYPHNPTGAIATRAFFEMLVQQARRYGWVIVHDAAYSALSFDKPLSLLQIPGACDCCVELHSMSKGFNMTGWRCGWMCGNETLISACARYKDNCDSGQFLAIQHASMMALDQAQSWLPALRRHYQERLTLLAQHLNAAGFRTLPARAGFFLYAACPTQVEELPTNRIHTFLTAEAFAHWLLENHGIVVVPWDEGGAYVRFSATFKTNDLSGFFDTLTQRLRRFRFV